MTSGTGVSRKVDRNVEASRRGLAHLVGDYPVPAVDEYVSDRTIEVEHHQPGLGEHLLQGGAGAAGSAVMASTAGAIVALMLLNQRDASVRTTAFEGGADDGNRTRILSLGT